MIKVFGKTDNLFSSNGDAVLKPTKAKVRKEDNGAFHLNLEVGLEYSDYIVDGNIVVANTPQGDQAFRITNPQKTKHKISVTAPHVFYDSKNYLIEDSYVVDNDCNYALDHLNSATSDISPFTTLSDITKIASYRCVRTSLHDAVFTVLERWGGHLVRNNFTIEIRDSIGQDNGVTVRYRKNLKDITCEENWDNVVTKLLPIGKDGLLLNAVDPTEDIYVYATIAYEIPYTKAVSFTQDINEDDFKDDDGNVDRDAYMDALVTDLYNQAVAYVENNCVPKVNYSLSANLEKMTDVGDTVEVVDERLGINILTNVIAFEYDCLLDKYVLVEFGNFQQSLSGLLGGITTSTEKIVDEKIEPVRVALGEELQTATDKIWSALEDSHVIYEGDKILVVDKLPKEQAQYCIMINSGGIGFSTSGINPSAFNSVWTIEGELDMQYINVINLTASMIKGGTLKLGSTQNESGTLEIYDEQNNLIGLMDKNGLKMYGKDGSYVEINNQNGFVGRDSTGARIYWIDRDEFHMKKSVIEEEITLCAKMRFIPITIMQGNAVINDGIGLVNVAGGA